MWAILSKDDILFAKSARVAQSKEWLGSGVFSQLDAEQHAASRATLNPAFRRDYLARLDSFMVASAQQLASILTHQAAAAGAGAGSTPSRVSTEAAAAAGQQGGDAGAVDMQRLFRLLTLDTIGLTSLNKSFDALNLWQQQQQGQEGANRDGGPSGNHSSSSGGGPLDLEQLLVDLESAFLWQALQLPVPSECQQLQPPTGSHLTAALCSSLLSLRCCWRCGRGGANSCWCAVAGMQETLSCTAVQHSS